MAHNPPRVWITDEQVRQVHRDVSRKLHQWHTLDELADGMLARSRQGKRVVLSPGTAEYVAKWIKGKVDEAHD